jgi:hypothetical protein
VKGKLDGKSKLKTLCATRWFSRANALATIKASVPVIVSNLEYLQTNDGKSGVHLSAIWLFLPLVVCSHILQTVAPITVTLQSSTSWDLIDVCEWMSNLDSTFWDWEKLHQLVYNTLYDEAIDLAEQCCVVSSKPRTTGRQRNRANSQVADKDYWRIILYY